MPRGPSGRQGRDHRTKGGTRRIGMCRVVANAVMRRVKAPRGRVDIVATFRHRQRHDANGRVAHCGNQGGVARLDRQIGDHRSDHLDRGACRVKLDQRRQTILRQQTVPHGRIVGAHPCADDRPILRGAGLHQPVQIPCLMRPVEVAQPDMHDAGTQLCAIIVRSRNRCRQIIQRCVGQRDRCSVSGQVVHQLIQLPPSTLYVCATIYSASSDARKTAMPVRSSARPMRP